MTVYFVPTARHPAVQARRDLGSDPIWSRSEQEVAQTGTTAVRAERAGKHDLEAICDIDALVLGSRDRCEYLAGAVDTGHGWVARISGVAVGFAIFAPSFFGQWFIELLVVHPGYRRLGVATALIGRCESICPAKKLFTSTNQSNTPMLLLLSRLNYKESGYVDNLDEGDPEIIFVKWLDSDFDR